MMQTILITLLSLLMISCGSMKKSKLSLTDKVSVKNEFTQEKKLRNTANIIENTSVKIENSSYNISVKPVNGQNSFFNFTSNDGQKFHGTTNAEISFEKKLEKNENSKSQKKEIITTYFSQVTYKSQTTYKTVTRYLDKNKKAYPWYLILIAGFILREIIGWFWKLLKNSQWYYNLFNNK